MYPSCWDTGIVVGFGIPVGRADDLMPQKYTQDYYYGVRSQLIFAM